jgi:glycosyltransferase involved in cell wall biosynthesis
MHNSSPDDARLRVAYLAVEATRQGHATYAHVHEIVKNLRRLDVDVDLFEPSSRTDRRRGLAARLFEQLRIQARLFARWDRYDAVYVRAHYTAFPTAALARLTGRPVVQEVNGPFDDLYIAHPWTRALRPVLSWLHTRQLAWADALVTVTPALRGWLGRQIGRADAEVIPNAANLELFSPERRTRRSLPDVFVVFVGALTTWQGIETLLAAFEHQDWPEEVHLVILGDGTLDDIVAAAAARHERLHWLGRVPYDEVGGIVAQALAGVVPKNARGNRQATGLFPLKLFEVVACGVPVIATDFPGQADFIREHECGVVIPPESAPSLAGAVRQLAGSPAMARKMGHVGRAAMNAGHSWTHRAHDTLRVLRRVTCRSAATPSHVSG